MGFESVRDYVESSDCLILLGAFMTDVNLGSIPRISTRKRQFTSRASNVRFGIAPTAGVRLHDFLESLLTAPIMPRTPATSAPAACRTIRDDKRTEDYRQEAV